MYFKIFGEFRGDKKREGKITKFCENFRDSPNLVNEYVINTSPKKLRSNFCDLFFTAFSDFLFKIFGDFKCDKKLRKKFTIFFTVYGELVGKTCC